MNSFALLDFDNLNCFAANILLFMYFEFVTNIFSYTNSDGTNEPVANICLFLFMLAHGLFSAVAMDVFVGYLGYVAIAQSAYGSGRERERDPWRPRYFWFQNMFLSVIIVL